MDKHSETVLVGDIEVEEIITAEGAAPDPDVEGTGGLNYLLDDKLGQFNDGEDSDLHNV